MSKQCLTKLVELLKSSTKLCDAMKHLPRTNAALLMKYEKLYMTLKVEIAIAQRDEIIALLVEDRESVKTEFANQPDDIQSDIISSIDEKIRKKTELVTKLKNDTLTPLDWDDYFENRDHSKYAVYTRFGDF